jgi:hydroxyethylthiazole kinase-like uncharacterized protein yjeF
VVGLVPEATVVLLPDGDGTSLARRAAEAISERLERSGAMVLGPGLGTDEGAAALLAALFGFTKSRAGIGFGTTAASDDEGEGGVIGAAAKPVVVDADALNWLAEQDRWWERVPQGLLVLTPHAGEMARLIGGDAADVVANPVRVARDAAVRWRQAIVLKGGQTVLVSADGDVATIEAPPSLATAGSGDVLGGSIGAFLAQGLSLMDAAALAAFAGCRAAQRIASRFGTLGVVASDLPAAIAEVLCDLEAREAEHESRR